MPNRRNFITWSMLGLSTLAIFKFFGRNKKKTEVARFLTQDGRLVEVETQHLPFEKKSVSKNRLMTWVWKNQKP